MQTGSAASGATFPMFSIIFGSVLDALGGSPSIAALVSQVNKVSLLAMFRKLLCHIPYQSKPQLLLLQVCLYFVYLAIVSFVASYGEVGLWMWTGAFTALKLWISFPHAPCTSLFQLQLSAVTCNTAPSTSPCIKICHLQSCSAARLCSPALQL